MKYLKKFDTEGEVFMVNMPNVVLVGDTNKVLYNVDSTGVYIQHIDGSLYSKDVWSTKGFANTEANGVAVVDKDAAFVVALKNAGSYIKWSQYTELVDGIFTTTNNAEAITDYEGLKNTDLIAANDTESAAYKCKTYEFPNGKKGYLPSAGEFKVLGRYASEVDEVLSLVGGSIICSSGSSAYVYWASTQASATQAWILYAYPSKSYSFNVRTKTDQKTDSFTYINVRPFTTL